MIPPVKHRPGDPRTEPRLESHAPTALGWALALSAFTLALVVIVAAFWKGLI